MSDMNQSSAGSASKVIISIAVLILAVAVGYALIYVTTDGAFMAGGSSSSSSSDAMENEEAMVEQETADDDVSQNDAMTAEEKAEYESCISAATTIHNNRWAVACENAAEVMKSAYLTCVQNGTDEATCEAKWNYAALQKDNCNLPAARANSLNAQYRASKQLCAR